MIATLNNIDGTYQRLRFIKSNRDCQIEEARRRQAYRRERSAKRLGIAQERRYGLQTLGEAAWRVVEDMRHG